MIKSARPILMRMSRAFTLLELSVSLAIIGLMMSGVMVMMADIVQTQAEAAAATDIREIADALKAYRLRNGHLPCPASYTTVYGSAEYGRQGNAGDCTYTVAPAGTTRVETAASSGIWVLTGAVPVRDLLMRDTFLKDQYGDRITYSVAQLLTDSATYDDNQGVITIKDSGGNDAITEGAYVLFSHGKDGKGAYREGSGALKVACGATANIDVENCDGDTVFTDAMFNDGAVVASYYDDTLIWKTKWDLIDPNSVQEEAVVGPDFTGFRVDGIISDQSGISVASGDINNDGYPDVIIGAHASASNGFDSGATYVLFGSQTGISASPFDVTTLDGTNGFKITGAAAYELAGGSVVSGDINGDNYDDIIIGARFATTNTQYEGSTFVVFGKASGWSPTFALTSLNGTNGFRADGSITYSRSGSSVGAGDVNGDGKDDLIIGEPLSSQVGGSDGAIYVVFGKASGWTTPLELSTLNGTTGFRANSPTYNGNLGSSLAVGNINGDDYEDIVAGARLGSKVFLLFGKASGWSSSFSLSTLDGTNGVRIDSAASDESGWSVATADVNNDNLDDILIGAPDQYNPSYNGSAYIVFGKSSGWAATFALSTLSGTNGFKLTGQAAADLTGRGIAGGDVNGDGFADIIVGAPGSDAGASNAGSTFVVFGKASGWGATFSLSTVDGTTGFRLNGSTANDSSGGAIATTDMTGDDKVEIIIGANAADYSATNAGSTYGVYGKSGVWSATYDLNTITVP